MDLEGVKTCLARHSGLFREAYVYGSVALGRHDEHSDVDLVLVRDTSAPFFDRIREVMDLVFDLGRVDLLIYTETERRVIQNEPGRYFIKDVFRKGIRIEGSQSGSSPMAATG